MHHTVNEHHLNFIGLYLFVKDIEATSAFYSALGLEIEHVSGMFGRATLEGEVLLEFGTNQLTKSYDPNFEEPMSLSKGTINFELASASAVETKFEQLAQLGYVGHLSPIDAPWQASFAIIEDPDGNYVGLHSPRDRKVERARETSAT